MSIPSVRLACMRRCGSSAIAIWLAVQIAGFAAPITLLAGGVEMLCTCPDTQGAACPMHHHNTGTPSADPGSTRERCALQNAHAPGMLALVSLSVIAVLPITAKLSVPLSRCALMAVMGTDLRSRTQAPDSLPPR
jgi:hypothetical protein